MSKAVENKIKKIYNTVFNQVFNKQRIVSLSNGSRSEVELSLAKIASSSQYNKFAEKFSKELAKQGLHFQKGIWRKYFEAAKKSHYVGLPKTFDEFEESIMKKAVENNFNMIKSIPNEILKVMNHKYTTELINEVIEGKKSRGSFKKLLEKHGYTNAGVVARTEAAKLQTLILENRATDLGSIAYIWLASNDKRTRPSHRAMNGVIVFWKQEKPLHH